MMYESTGKRETLLHSAAKFAYDIIYAVSQIHQFKHLHNALFLFYATQTINFAEKLHIFSSRQIKV